MKDKLARALAVTPYLFSGQQGVLTDPNGLLYMRARYYHPGLRRFVNPDPIGFEGGSNWYGYAGGNPLMANDPSGLAVRQPPTVDLNAHYGSKLGGTLGNIPMLGMILGPLGTMLSGIGNAFMGDVGTGMQQLGHGIGVMAHDTIEDAATFGLGMTAGKAVGLYRTFTDNGTNFPKILGELMKTLVIPTQLGMTGANVGIRPDSYDDSSFYMSGTKTELAGWMHDQERYWASNGRRGFSSRSADWNWIRNATFGPGYEPGTFGQGIRIIGIPTFFLSGLVGF